MIYPVPQRISFTKEVSLTQTPALKLNIDDNSLVAERVRLFDTVVSDNANVIVNAKCENTRSLCYIDKRSRFTEERYLMDIAENGGKIEICVRYSNRRSLWYALNTVDKMVAANCFPVGSIEDYPLFEIRGFIEGFYGTIWKYEQRVEMLKIAAYNGMNAFYYAPKDDPYHRRLWKELYPEKELSDLASLVKISGDYCIDFHYNIAPGLTIQYTSEADFNALIDKIKQLYSIGVRNFGLLLDDIPETFEYMEDIAAYGEMVNAHIDLVNRFYDAIMKIDGSLKLTVCPKQYHGRGTEYYISKFGQGIVPEAALFWTGSSICSKELTVPEALRFMDSTMHRPLYWDNYPVNDAEMYNEMHLGPIIGRDEDLYRYSKGIIANCMEYFECTKVPLMTIADYLWNPLDYDKEKSYENALGKVIGVENVATFALFGDHLRTACLQDINSGYMSEILARSGTMLQKGEFEKGFELLGNYVEEMKKCVILLQTGKEKIYTELRRWSDKFALCTEILELGMKYLLEGEDADAEKFKEKSYQYNFDPTILTGFCFREFMEFITNRD